MEPSLVHIWWRMSKPHMDSVRHLYEYILVGKLCVKTTPRATCEAGLGGGMDLEWLGLAWSVTGIHGACRRPGAYSYSALGV